MSLTTALFTALTGMDVHTKALDVIGNNITNVNTIGFKGSRAVFESQLNSSLTFGTAPTGESGGTNPTQIGLGVQFAGTQRNFANGSIQPTGINTDLALEGPGFFILRQNNETFYTRAGAFDLDADKRLVGVNGAVLQGFGVDSNFNLVQGVLTNMVVPTGTLTVAEATRNVRFKGNLNASGPAALNGSQTTSQALQDLTAGPGAAVAATVLTDLSSDGVVPLFATGDVVTIQGVEKGSKALGVFRFEVGPANTTGADDFGTTLQDLMDFFNDVLGINGAATGAGITPGVTINASGQIVIEGDHGTVNDINLQTADILSTGTITQPFQFTKNRSADGESVRTTFVVYDSLGTPLAVDVSVVLENKSAAGTDWRFYAESADDTDVSLVLGSGTLEFDTFGRLVSVDNPTVNIDRVDTGAVDPLSITLNFDNGSGQDGVNALSLQNSLLVADFQDGSPVGTLSSFSIGQDGVILGAFSNGLTRTLGQVALANFSNPEGLVEVGNTNFIAGPNSGLAVEVAPLSFGAARVVAGALELSNVDLSQEFVNLITISAGFSAASRVITTSDQLIQQLLATAR